MAKAPCYRASVPFSLRVVACRRLRVAEALSQNPTRLLEGFPRRYVKNRRNRHHLLAIETDQSGASSWYPDELISDQHRWYMIRRDSVIELTSFTGRLGRVARVAGSAGFGVERSSEWLLSDISVGRLLAERVSSACFRSAAGAKIRCLVQGQLSGAYPPKAALGQKRSVANLPKRSLA